MIKKYLFPQIARAELTALIGFMAIGAILAGVYGILHDQITFSIGHEYFHNFKFQQFAHSNFGLPDRVFVSIIGFEATWWVGAVVGWILARRLLPHQSRRTAIRQIMTGLLIVLGCGALGGFTGYLYGLWRGPDADYSMWMPLLKQHLVQDHWSFMRVGYIHNTGYIGAFIGLILTFVLCPGNSRTE